MAWIETALASVQADRQRHAAANARRQEVRKRLPDFWKRLAEVFHRDVAAIGRAAEVTLKVNHTGEFLAVSRPINDFLIMVTLDGGAGLIRCQYSSGIPNSNATWTIALSEGGEIEVHAASSQRAMSCEQLSEAMLGPVLRFIA